MVFPFPRPFPGPSMVSFNVLSLFASGEQGAWYDPSDFSTMFQDSAGTTPVTAVEQPVGLIRDKSGRNNHASQATSTSRPVLSARVNLLTYSEQFDNAAWTKGSGVSVSANSEAAPDGTITADQVTFATGGGTEFLRALPTMTVNTTYTFSVYARLVSGGATFTVDYGNVGVSGSLTPTSVWQRFSYTFTFTGASSWVDIQASAGCTIAFWGADLRVTNDGVGIPAYQRVNAATDYDTNGFPLYLAFDGVDDSLSTASIDFSATDKMTVFAGVRKLSDAAVGIVAELSADVNVNNGTFWLIAPQNAGVANVNFASKGTLLAGIGATGLTAPVTTVLSGLSDISGDTVVLRLNGVQSGTSAADQGTGNYGNYPLYIGRRGGSSLPFNGRLYSLIVRGAASNADQISRTETWVNAETGAY